ncbi:hypothetical protein [Thiocapsa marina]|uniref:Uncharacterized protein n=1 Tax=Thiocapsa marina 5811 TaxID=768671 RepID=F9U9J8_9GAMM|nr:hypothetical protein [Thiocapsa marina]EGV18796.1 hypothetical protein ThimaDRAFT_1600 [Thiocapsa marina 5811]
MRALATKTEGERSAPGGATAAANRQRDLDGFTGPSLLEPALEPAIGPESESSSAIGEKVPEAVASDSKLGPGQRAMGSLSRLNAIVNRSAKVAALSKLDVALNARPDSGEVARVATPRRNPVADEGLSTIAAAPMGAGRGAEGTTVEQRFPVIDASAPAEQAGGEQEASGAAPERSSASLIAFMRQPASEIAGGFDAIGPALAGQMGTERMESNARPPEIQAFLPGADPGASDQGPRLGQNPLPNAVGDLLEPADPAGPEFGAQEAQVPGQPGGHNLSTDAGPAPTYRVDGETSPARADATRANASSQAAGARDALAGDIASDRSGERIQPIGVDRADALKLEEKDRSIRTESSLEMLDYAGAPVPGSVFQIADGDLAPLLDASLEGPRRQIADAAAKRDQSRAEAVQQGQQEADQARDQAHAEQQAAIADGRRQVEATKQQGLTESQAELRRFETQADAEHERTRGDIESRIATDQAAADKAIADGEQQARAEQAEAERQAAEAEAEKQRRKTRRKKKGLWGKIVGWVVEISQAVLDWFKARLNDIFDLAKRAIKGILEGAKKLAVGIVRSLRTAVIGMIKGLATVLTTLVSTFLFFLPSLRDRINGAIDNVVSNTVAVVDRIAQTLEDKVSALVDKVGGLLNRVVEVFEIAVMTTLTVTAALLRGDFKGAARALFIAACKTLGIDGEMLLSILADAASALIHIIKKPASFLGNLLKSVKQGFGSFVANFKDRFSQGMGGWLFGNLAQGGAQLPSKLDLKSIFTMITQVLGFTFEFVRGRAVRKVGEHKVGILEQVLTQVKTLVTEGPAAVWNWVKDQAAKLKTLVVETVSDWMVTQLVAKAAMKLATMFTPVGAFIQAIKMMYDTIMFFIEKAKDIMALVKSITASFKQMAQGAVAAAANYIDQSMAKAIPLIIAFLAKLVGLGGLGAKVRRIVTKLREPVTRAIDFVLDKIIGAAKATWKGIKTGVQRLADWWNARETFRDQDGEEHQLYFERAADGGTYRLMLASDPQDMEIFLRETRGERTPAESAEIDACYVPIKRATHEPSKTEDDEARSNIVRPSLAKLRGVLERMRSGKPMLYPSGEEVGVGEQLFAGALLGNFVKDPSYWHLIGQAIVGFTPYGVAADIRDTIEVLNRLFLEKQYSDPYVWLELALVLIGYIPGVGDLIKLGGRAALKSMRRLKYVEALLKYGAEAIQRIVATTARYAVDLVSRAKEFLGRFVSRISQRPQTIEELVWVNTRSKKYHRAGSRHYERIERTQSPASHWEKMPVPAAETRGAEIAGDSVLGSGGFTKADERRLRSRVSKPIRDAMVDVGDGPFFDPLVKGIVAGAPEADHIVPFSKIIRMEGFDKLTPQHQKQVLSYWRNFQAFAPDVNASRGNRTFAEWRGKMKGWEHRGIDEKFLDKMIGLETELDFELRELINAKLRRQ